MRLTSAPSPTSVSVRVVSGPMRGARADRRRAEQLGAGQDRRVAADGDVAVDPRGVGVDDRHALAHPALGGAAVELLAEPARAGPGR